MDKATPDSLRARCNTALQSLPDAQYKTMLAALFDDLLAGRIAAQSAPTEIHADTPRHELLPRLRRLASDFQSHPLSRSISECEEAGELMTEAAAEIERLCRVRNCLAGSSRTRTARLRQLEQQRDYLLAEMCRIDNDTGNAGHYASEAVAAICAEEGARDVSKECTCSAADMPFGRCCKMKNNLPSRDWSAS